MKLRKKITFLTIILLSSLAAIPPALSYSERNNSPQENINNGPKLHQDGSQPALLKNLESQQTAAQKEKTVFITRSEKTFHSKGCACLTAEMVPFGINNAKSRGYKPCSHCRNQGDTSDK